MNLGIERKPLRRGDEARGGKRNGEILHPNSQTLDAASVRLKRNSATRTRSPQSHRERPRRLECAGPAGISPIRTVGPRTRSPVLPQRRSHLVCLLAITDEQLHAPARCRLLSARPFLLEKGERSREPRRMAGRRSTGDHRRTLRPKSSSVCLAARKLARQNSEVRRGAASRWPGAFRE